MRKDTSKDRATSIGETFGTAVANLVNGAKTLTVLIESTDEDFAYVTAYDGDDPTPVRLLSAGLAVEGLKLTPNVGSVSLIAFLNGDKNAPYFVAHSEIDTVTFTRGKTSFTWKITPPERSESGDPIDGETDDEITLAVDTSTLTVKKDLWEFNGGTLGGLVIVGDLTTRLNKLQNEIDQIQTAISTHTHTVATTGSAAAQTGSTTATTYSKVTLTQVKDEDYVNEKITQ